MAKTSDALAILGRRLAGDAELRRMVEEETLNARIAQMIHDLRKAAGLSQAELAKRIGTRQPAIARLEDADYEGHSLPMLARIAAALGAKLEVRMIPGAGSNGGRTRPAKPVPPTGSGKKGAPSSHPRIVSKAEATHKTRKKNLVGSGE